jgi:hypothetical protein
MAYHGASDRALQMDQVFIAHPLIRPYFYDGVPVPDDDGDNAELRNRVLAVAEFVVDILEDCWDNEDCYAGEDRDAWMHWIYEVFESSPAASTLYAENVEWYPKLTKLFEEEGSPPRSVLRAMTAPAGEVAPAPQAPPAASKSYERTSSQTSIE